MVPELQARQGVEVRGCEELQRVPPQTPGIAGPLIPVQDHERLAPLGKVIADSQAGLAAADDDRVNLLDHEATVGASTLARHR